MPWWAQVWFVGVAVRTIYSSVLASRPTMRPLDEDTFVFTTLCWPLMVLLTFVGWVWGTFISK